MQASSLCIFCNYTVIFFFKSMNIDIASVFLENMVWVAEIILLTVYSCAPMYFPTSLHSHGDQVISSDQ